VTGNLKASQKLLNHASIQTTADIYSDWDMDQLTATMAEVLDSESVQSSGSKNPRLRGFGKEMETMGSTAAKRWPRMASQSQFCGALGVPPAPLRGQPVGRRTARRASPR
jgi:hypothetical protein